MNVNKVQWVYASRDNRELRERYDAWASDYEADLEAHDQGYLGPRKAAEVVARYVHKTARLLDAGAGTGLVGEVLSAVGFDDIAAIDLSPRMLEEARRKGVYGEMRPMVLGERLDYFDDTFDAVVCVGTLTQGHAPAESLDEFVRITLPMGYVVFTLRPDVYEREGFRERQDALERAGKWRLVERGEPFQTLPKSEPGVLHQVWAYQVLAGRE
jgi:ubiquinone/menaquinone biosynthesis C-methylase UbiE